MKTTRHLAPFTSIASSTKATALRIPRLIRLLTLTGMLAAPAAHAVAVVNGGFETGDLTGWTKFEPNGITVRVVSTATVDGQNADGSWFVDLGSSGQQNFSNGAYIQQTVPGITANSPLTLSFEYSVEYNSSTPRSASTPALGVSIFDSITLSPVVSQNYNQVFFGGDGGNGTTPSSWTQVVVNFAATTSNPLVIRFTDLSTTGIDPQIDLVSLVPEPSTVSLLGLGALVLVRRKRTSTK